jgi:hypothetical protein
MLPIEPIVGRELKVEDLVPDYCNTKDQYKRLLYRSLTPYRLLYSVDTVLRSGYLGPTLSFVP